MKRAEPFAASPRSHWQAVRPSRPMASQFNAMNRLGRCALAMSLALLPGPAAAQDRETQATLGVTLLAGLGNDFGWLGTQVSAPVRPRRALFAGVGYTPALDEGDPSGITFAAGLRGFSRGTRHRGLLEIGVTQIVVETSVTPLAGVRGRRLYGPSAQLGYQYISRGGLTALVTVGVGYTVSSPLNGSRFQPAIGLGLGYILSKRA